MPVMGFYIVACGSVVHGFHMTVDLPGDEMVPLCGRHPVCTEQRRPELSGTGLAEGAPTCTGLGSGRGSTPRADLAGA